MHMTFPLAVAIAANFWGSHAINTDGHPTPAAPGRGIVTPCHPQAVPVGERTMSGWGDDGAIMAAFAWPVACDVYVTPRSLRERTVSPAEFCADVTHEVGNIDGVPETDDAGWVTSISFTDASVPSSCRHWRGWAHQHWPAGASGERQGSAASSPPAPAGRR